MKQQLKPQDWKENVTSSLVGPVVGGQRDLQGNIGIRKLVLLKIRQLFCQIMWNYGCEVVLPENMKTSALDETSA